MKTITKKQFLADVMHEIDMLKLHATDEEKSRLDFNGFNPLYVRSCIYGQLTCDCTSKRAMALMNLACIRQMNCLKGSRDFKDKEFSKIAKFINGPYDGKTWDGNKDAEWGNHFFRQWSYISALEGYINLSGAKNKQIIAYIKGETNKLIL